MCSSENMGMKPASPNPPPIAKRSKRPPAFSAGLAILFLLSIFVFPQAAARAHPMDMYAQEGAVRFSRQGLLLDWKITPGPMLAGAIWDTVDQNQDGSVSHSEALAWIEPVTPLWTARLDGQQDLPFQLQGIQWPASFDEFQAGSQPVEVQLFAAWPAGLTGGHVFEIHNTFQEPISLNWFSLACDPGLAFEAPEQTNGQLETTLHFPAPGTGAASPAENLLTAWESGRPNVPGLTGVVTGMAVNLANAQPAQNQAAGPTSALIGLVKTGQFSPLFLAGAFLLSIALGALHALTPGHGKTLVAAYLVGSHGRTRDAIFLGSVVTVTHTGSVLLLGLATLIASRYILPAVITPWLEILSGTFIILFGLNLFIRRGRELLAWLASERAGKYPRRRYTVQALSPGADKQGLAAAPHSHALSGHTHPHLHPHDEHSPGHPHSHALPANQVTWKSLLTLGVSGGLVPCPDAIAILLVAVTVNKIPFGMLLIVAFSFGLALVLIAIGIAMVQGLRILSRNELVNRFSLYSPLVSAVVVLGLGAGLTWTSLHSFSNAALPSAQTAGQAAQNVGSPPVTPGGKLLKPQPAAGQSAQTTPLPAPPFDLQTARLLYLAADRNNQNQLFVVPVSGGEPAAITHEASGVLAFSLSADRKTVLYSVLDLDGESSIWKIDPDGSNARQVLDCAQAQCGDPVWSPDGQKLFYERHDYSQNAAVPIFSIWWLDVASGETRPVFQDQSFPSFAPRFSPDGQWLSYISPSTNTIQVYNLNDDRSLSIPTKSGILQIWSPASDALLYWDTVSADVGAAIHLKKYDLASGQSLDLGGGLNQGDYLADWSPDGRWIAVVRDSPSASDAIFREQLALIGPDGKPAAALMDEPETSIGDLNWSPDSRYLVFSRYSNVNLGNPEIWLVDVASGQAHKILAPGVQARFIP